MGVEKVFWFNTTAVPTGMRIGIILGRDEKTGKKKACIGVSYDINEDFDTRVILNRGAELDPETVNEIQQYFQTE